MNTLIGGIYIYTYIYIYMRIYVYVYLSIHTYTHTYIFPKQARACRVLEEVDREEVSDVAQNL